MHRHCKRSAGQNGRAHDGWRSRQIAVAALLFALSIPPAAAAEPSLRGKVIGIAAIGTAHHWDYTAQRGQIDAVRDMGGRVAVFDAGLNHQTLIIYLRTLIKMRPDAIIQQLGNLDVIEPWLARVRAAGIPLFTVDTPSRHSLSTVGSDNHAIGAHLAHRMAEDMRGVGYVLVFNGFPGVPVCGIRHRQLMNVVRSFPEIRLVRPELRDVMPDTIARAYMDTTEALAKYGPESGLKAIWACWDRPMIGAARAVDRAGRAGIRVYGIDGSPEFVAMVTDPGSSAQAVMVQRPYEIGGRVVEIAARYLAGEQVPLRVFVSAFIRAK